MSVDVSKSYDVSCDSPGCCNATPKTISEELAIQDAISVGWVQRKKNFYCDECKDKPENQPKKRGRKPKEKPPEIPNDSSWEDLKKEEPETTWTPPEV